MPSHIFKPSETVDFVVVGSGAAGGVIARELSQAGFSVVVLEQGPRLGTRDFEHDELKYNYLSGITNSPSSPQTFRDDPTRRQFNHAWAIPTYAHRRRQRRALLPTTGAFTNDFNERSLLGAIRGTGFAGGPSATRA